MLGKLIATGAGAGALAGAYAFIEPYRFRLQTHELPARPGAPELSILHVSDLHLTGKNERRAGFVRSIADRLDHVPDFVMATGDLIEEDDGIDLALDALAPLEARLGKFYVLGSHDYYQSKFKSPTKYLTGRRAKVLPPQADVERLEAGLASKGWVSLTNRADGVEADGMSITLAGIDDPYLNRHRTDHIARRDGDAFAIGLMHAPDVISEWAHAGFDLVLAGHTHGGQLRLPFAGALVTNSSLPTRLAMGPSRIGEMWLHVSPGLGTSRFTPVRFLCRPEVTLIRMAPGI